MKRLIYSILFLGGFALLLSFSSCKVTQNYKDIRVMEFEYDSLEKGKDFQIISSLAATATIQKKAGKLLPAYSKNYKQGYTNNLMWSPGQMVVLNKANNFYAAYAKSKNPIYLYMAKKMERMLYDDGTYFALYALFEKYPDIDYFTNVIFDRVIEKKGFFIKKTTETINVKAKGIELVTDK